MKNKIIIDKKQDIIRFYISFDRLAREKYFLFAQRYSKGVYEFFYRGRSEDEVRSYKKWGRNPRLDKTITKIPMYLEYLLKNVVESK